MKLSDQLLNFIDDFIDDFWAIICYRYVMIARIIVLLKSTRFCKYDNDVILFLSFTICV